jgi:hypothetical protein
LSVSGDRRRTFHFAHQADSNFLGNMYLANRYSQSTCNNKVHTVPLGTAPAKVILSAFPSRIYLRRRRPKPTKNQIRRERLKSDKTEQCFT